MFILRMDIGRIVHKVADHHHPRTPKILHRRLLLPQQAPWSFVP